jgi:MoaA/NifB/PqqE/SkfB family radical SAM enzyme
MSFWKKIFPSADSGPHPEALYYGGLTGADLRDYNRARPLGPQEKICYAPFKNLYFGWGGQAVACCYNRQHVMGVYPQQSIREIWFGEKADELRRHLENNDLSKGCNGCLQQLLAGNFDATKAKQYDELPLNANRFPSVMEFELSNVCNLECEMCSGDFSSLIRENREKRAPLPIVYDAAFVEQLEEFIPYLTEVKFYGGEPFLIEIYYQIWEKIMAIKPQIRISVQTNGTVLNNRVKNILAKTNFHLNVSFDSLQKETYEAIRVNAKFERVLENMRWFREYTRERGTFFGISACMMRQNWQEAPDFIRFCNEWDCPAYFHSVFYPLDSAIRALPKSELSEIRRYLEGFSFPEETPIQKKNSLHYQNFVQQVAFWEENAPETVQPRSARSLDQLYELMAEHLHRSGEPAQQAGPRLQVIRGKIDELQALVQDRPELMDRLATVRFEEASAMDQAVRAAESFSATELLAMLTEIPMADRG